MKWAPVLVVLGAFGVLLMLTRPGAKSGEARGSQVVAAQQSGSSHGLREALRQEPAAAPKGHGAPAANAAAPAPRTTQGADSGKAVEPVKAPVAKPPPAKKPDSIVGEVRDESGAPRPQLVVLLIGGGKEVARQPTDSSGRFAFENVAPGEYALTTHDPDFLYTASKPAAVSAKKGATAETTLTVDRGTSGLRGVVVDGTKKPMADQRIVLSAGGATLGVNSDAKGLFVVNGLVPGSWRVKVDGFEGSERTVALKADATADVAFELARPASLSVELAGSALHPLEIDGGEHVWLRKAGDGASAPTATALQVEHAEPAHGHHSASAVGKASFANLTPGAYEVEIVDGRGRSLLQTGAPWASAVPVTLREGEQREVVLATAKAALGRGITVPTWAIVLMCVVIGGLVFVTPVMFPAPLAPKRPADKPSTGPAAAH